MLLLIDNYDSFTFNLLHAVAAFESDVRVVRNDRISVDDIERMAPEILVISPGPGSPASAGVSVDAIRASLGRRPVLGVCLGHQSLGVALGARVRRAHELVHGKARALAHNGAGIFTNLPSPIDVARYHSLVLDPPSLPPELETLAWSQDGEIMALSHRKHCAFGVQFHPESFLTKNGRELLANFFELARK
ncbi:MAG: aminodeoxychorismate/anthranilate synthase component II [Planctomycetes bacterium]|nr:aminodeoxychorismate/anthranilate synthase component II [Planctomycetota bacterium]